MPINKNAYLRYNALDKCFSNFSKNYYIEDLVDACNRELYNFTGTENGIKKRQVFSDIQFMESPQGWNIELERIPDGKRVYYRYYDKKFTISKQPINQIEAVQIQNALTVLHRFKGVPQFEWIEEVGVRLHSAFNLKSNSNQIVFFENNPYLKGLEYFEELFNYIYAEKVIEITYKSFKRNDIIRFIISPYFLKQYNNRWYLFGLNHEINEISNIPIDRIECISEHGGSYIKNNSLDFEEIFDDIVGVTNIPHEVTQKVILEVSSKEWNYIQTKPIHGSQKVIAKNEHSVTIELELKVNHELIMLLFSFGPGIRVLSPSILVEQIKTKALAILDLYK